ncbi:hypothetical protein QYQ99_26285 [Comamonas testosteroni]|uniref:hypothetical protein n=1 Tax=Comamonas testosteroni TaxID=285 RepID=UPI00265E2BB8|nr:hypothetical protein [Comamonas testosteroni]WKL15791.1 hypothetical protein QYQ99_26285 [Comamonas testosteroni]
MHELEETARDVVDSWESGDLAGAVTQLGRLLNNQDLNRAECADEIARAREIHADDQCVIDPLPLVAPAEDGTYVAAWLWIPNP